jgi:carboxyl-terminal processing protease
LDYTNTDEKGNVPKFTKSTETYKTEKGRTVYGGGGIFPDVEIEKPTTTKTTEILLNSDAFFNYATQYFYQNPTISEPSKFKLADSDYASFKSYLGKNHASFETKAEAEFKKALETASAENLNGNTSKGYSELLTAIQAEKFKELDKNKEEITNELSEEIIKRYYYAEGVYQQKAIFDPVILKAVFILNNEKDYRKIIGQSGK